MAFFISKSKLLSVQTYRYQKKPIIGSGPIVIGQAKQALNEFGIYHNGRQGDFEYLLSDPVIANAQAMAKKMTEDLRKKA